MTVTRLVAVLGIVTLFGTPTRGLAQPGVPSAVSPDAVSVPETIPIFPLQDVVLFPTSSRPLHIFEPRYRAMVADALRGDRIIGMVLLRPGHEADYQGRPPVYPVGCAGLITEVEELPNGRYTIVLRGLVKFRVLSEDQSRPYRLARIETIPEPLTELERVALGTQRQRLTDLLVAVVPGSAAPPPALSDEEVVNTLAQYLDLDPLARQDLLERQGSLSRGEALIDLLNERRR